MEKFDDIAKERHASKFAVLLAWNVYDEGMWDFLQLKDCSKWWRG